MTEQTTNSPGIALPARTIPTPRSVSPEAQRFLSTGIQIAAPQIPLDNKEGWRRYIAAVESQIERIAAERAKPYPARIVEHQLSAATIYEVVPASLSSQDEDKAILYVHGGAFIVGGGRTAAYSGQALASAAGLRLFSVDYRMPPDHPFPTGLNDVLEGYRMLLERYDPAKIAFHGSSAGANIAAAAILKARDLGLPLPGACVLHTASVDLTQSGDSFATNETIDVVLRSGAPDALMLYAGEHKLDDPLVSPLFGDFDKGFPPTILLSGTRDLLLSSTVMMHRVLRRAGIAAELHVFEAMPHGGFGDTAPEDRELLAETVSFVRARLGDG